MERINKVCQDASASLKRAAAPMTARWTLHHTLPKMAAQAVEVLAFGHKRSDWLGFGCGRRCQLCLHCPRRLTPSAP